MNKEQEEKIKQMYSLRRPLKQISKATGIPTNKIIQWLKEKHLWTGHRSLLNYFDEFYFDDINTEEKAYWLGFIYADGYLNKNSNTIGIELNNKDKEHLEKFRQTLKAENTVKTYSKNSTYGPQINCRFTVNSAHMKKILLSYYKSINKTFEGEFPKLYDSTLIRHLIRGFFDGDGSLIGIPKDDKHIFRPSVNFIGTKETLKYVEDISGFSWNWSQRVQDISKNNYQITCSRVNDCLTFLNFMYKDANVYLNRKYEKYQLYLESRARLITKVRV